LEFLPALQVMQPYPGRMPGNVSNRKVLPEGPPGASLNKTLNRLLVLCLSFVLPNQQKTLLILNAEFIRKPTNSDGGLFLSGQQRNWRN
jgi:hypothetical protein